MATAPSPNDLTRQQLDELDALLQKMLTVPIAVDPPPAPPLALVQPPLPPSWRIDPPAPAPSLAHLSLDEPPAPKAPAKPALASPPVAAPKPVAAAPKPAPVPVPRPVPAPQPVVVPPGPQAAKAVMPAPEPPPVPLVFLPFVALNGLFDNICGIFGPPGRLLRSGFFKQLYGLAGLGLIAYTALHVAQVQAWLTLPVVLPWPR